MSDKAVQTLLVRYADGLKLCNCRMAYYGKGWALSRGKKVPHPCCPSGCMTNQSSAAEYVCQRACEELGLLPLETRRERIWDREPKPEEW